MTTDAGPPVFVLSTGRAGSNMLARALAVLPGVCSLHEPQPHLVTEGYLRWKGRLSPDRALQYVRHKRADLIGQVSDNGLQYVESSHYWAHLVPELHRAFDARFVFLHRDGRRFAQSGLARESWYGPMTIEDRVKSALRRATVKPIGHPWFDHRLDPPRNLSSRVERLAWLWCEINEVILRDLAEVPEEHAFQLPLESINAETLGALASFLGRDAAPPIVDQMAEVASSRPNSSESSGRVRQPWSDGHEEAFLTVANATMERLGYSTSSSAVPANLGPTIPTSGGRP